TFHTMSVGRVRILRERQLVLSFPTGNITVLKKCEEAQVHVRLGQRVVEFKRFERVLTSLGKHFVCGAVAVDCQVRISDADTGVSQSVFRIEIYCFLKTLNSAL